MKYYEILPTHTETPRNTTRKIANLYIEFNYHFFDIAKKIPLLLNRSVRLGNDLCVKVQFRVLELFRERGHYLKKNLTWLESSGLSHYIYILFTMFIMHFDVEFSSVSMTSRPTTIGKIAMFWWSCRDHDVTMQVHESSQPILRCKAWQPRTGDAVDKLTASCHVDRMAAVSWSYVGNNVKITSEWRPSVHNRINNLAKKV